MVNSMFSDRDFAATYGRTWKLGAVGGQHEEAGYVIETDDGVRVASTPDVYDVAHALGLNHHDPQVWRAYTNLPLLIVETHNRLIAGRRNI